MTKKRLQWLTAGGLLLGTCLAAAVTRGGRGVEEGTGGATFIEGGRSGPVSLHATLDRKAVLRGADGTARVELVIAADEMPGQAPRRATDLVIVLDRSGSMAGEKMTHALASVRELVHQLGPEDRLSLVSYASDSRVDLPLTAVSTDSRTRIETVLSGLYPSGGTNMSAGLDLGLQLVEGGHRAERIPRVILISDGLANEGDASPQGLIERARRAARGEYMLSTVGVGADFNEILMTTLADAGTGNYYYVRHAEDLGSVFVREFDAARSTVATGLVLRVEPAAGVRLVDAAGYPLERSGDSILVRPGSLFSGQERRIWLTLAIPSRELGEYELGRFALAYSSAGARHEVSLVDVPKVACVAGEDEFYAGVDVDAWTRSVVVDQYNAVQKEIADAVKRGDRDAARHEVSKFESVVGSMNERLKAAPVAESLRKLDELEAEVDRAFAGDEREQAHRQNELSKTRGAAALDDRRVGAKKEVRP